MVGQYRITGLIGVGGMGAVYSAEHVLLERPAAVKLLLPEVSGNPEIVGRFFNEARAAAAIQHPGIVEIYDFGWHSDGSAYIVMEHLRGENLAARSARGRMAPSVVMAFARQIASALAVAHGKGIVHRDLKPDNIFLVRDSEVIGGERIKLLDFGVAKIASSDERHRTRAGAILGTPTYMAPEQCRGMAVDHRADLYALGCVLFELCTGAPPFVGAGDGEVLAAHIHRPAPPIASAIAGLPPALATLIDRLLSKPREQRVQSAEAVVQAMDAATGLDARPRGWWLGVALAVPAAIAAVAIVVASDARGPRGELAASGAAAAPHGVGQVDTPAATPAAMRRASPPVAEQLSNARAAMQQSAATVAEQRPTAKDLQRATATRAQRPPVVRHAAPAVPALRPGAEDEAGRMTDEPVAPAEPPSTDTVATQYAAVGLQLTALRERRGTAETADLWSRYLSIQINEALVDPVRRVGDAELLRQLCDQIAERAR